MAAPSVPALRHSTGAEIPQLGLGVFLPKSANPERIAENIDVFDFELGADDLRQIAALDSEGRIGPHPDGFGG